MLSGGQLISNANAETLRCIVMEFLYMLGTMKRLGKLQAYGVSYAVYQNRLYL